VGVYETAEYRGVKGVSMAGGGQVQIAEQGGLNDTPMNNQIMLTTSDVSTTAITLAGTPLTEDDEFQSQASNGKLVYTLPSVSYLFNGLPLNTFSQFSTITT
jgi:cyanophycinase-like exopeptidase